MLLSYFSLLSTLIRLRVLRVINRKAAIIFGGYSIISKDVDIDVSDYSKLQIGKGVRIKKNVYLAIRDNAKLILGRGVFINRNSIIVARESIEIGDEVTIGPNVCIYDHDHDIYNPGSYECKKIVIKDNAWIGANVSILKGVIIGKGAVIASGSVVSKDVPDRHILIQKRENQLKKIN